MKKSNIKIYLTFLLYIWKQSKMYCILTFIKAIVDAITPIFFVVISKYLIDSLVYDKSFKIFLSYIALLVIMTVVALLVEIILGALIPPLLEKVKTSVSKDALQKIYTMQYSLYDDPESYNIINRAFNYATNDITGMINVTLLILSNVISVISYTYIIGQYSIFVIFIIIFWLVLNMIFSRSNKQVNFKYNRDVSIFRRKIDYYKGLFIKRAYLKEIKLNTALDNTVQKYEKSEKEFVKRYVNVVAKRGLINTFSQLNTQGMVMILVFSLGKKVISGVMTIGDYTLAHKASVEFTTYLENLIMGIGNFYGNFLESQNYVEFLELVKEKNGDIDPFETETETIIEFKNVDFKYPNQDKYVFKNFSFKLQTGTSLTILGDNGTGKSTLIKLILRFYRVEKGEILINGININSVDIYKYYKKLGIVFQDFELISGISMYENINLFNEDVSEDMLKILMKKLEISEQKFDIHKNYSKLFDSDGLEISGGERQKIALMRAMLKAPKVMILDESSSALDIISEDIIFNTILNENIHNTVIFISHRLAIAKKSDHIIFMRDGKIAEEGTHDELMKLNKNYKKWIDLQQKEELANGKFR